MLYFYCKVEIEIIIVLFWLSDYVGSNGSGDREGDRQFFFGVERLINYIVKNMGF